MQPLSGILVVDFSRYLPGAFASRELLELGARVVCVEPPGGDPMRSSAPAWDAALRAGHDLNYLGWAGVLWDTAPAWPPTQIADLAAGALGAVTKILAALLERDRTGKGRHIVVSMTHGSHRFVAHRLGDDTGPSI